MSEQDLKRLRRDVRAQITELGIRIRRYTLDKGLDGKVTRHEPKDAEARARAAEERAAKEAAAAEQLKTLDALWAQWNELRAAYYAPGERTEAELRKIEDALFVVDRSVDVIQRDLVSKGSLRAGALTTFALGLALAFSLVVYALTHGVALLPPNFSDFEPLAEWGPLKYVEVAFWSFFGVMCWLIYIAAWYTARRDFDKWYQPWYLATAVRAPLLTMLLMVIVLEFVEYWAEDSTWMQSIVADGNKFYFIVFMSFSLGLISDQSSAIARDLAVGVGEAVQVMVQKWMEKLRGWVEPPAK